MKLIFSKKINTLDATKRLVDEVLNSLPRGSLLLLDGQLASGKTTFISFFCEKFKFKIVQSPTYAIHQRYKNDVAVIDHFDLYRLETEDEIESAGFFDLLDLESDYKLIEWSNRIQEDFYLHKKNVYRLTFNFLQDGSRAIDFYALSFAKSSSNI